MLDVGTFWFIFSGFLLMLMSAMVFRDPKNSRVVLFGVVLSGALVLIFQTVHLFLPKVLSLGILSSNTGNVLGSWNSFGIFAGFVILVALLVIEFFQTTKVEKLILQLLILLGVVLVAAVNFPLIWILLGIFSLIIFVFKILPASKKNEDEEHKIHFPVSSFVIVIISLLFFISGSFVGGIIPSRFGISNTEVSPTLQSTMSVAGGVLKHNPIFGIGPNKFQDAWAMYKPLEINNSINGVSFWNVSFSFGSGLLPTFITTTGYIGILAWLIFFILFLWSGIKTVLLNLKHGTNWETTTFFILSLYLFVACFFYAVGTAIFLLALALAGVFMGLLSHSSPQGEIELHFLSDHRKSFFSILFLLIIIIASIATAFKFIERFVSVSYFRKALAAQTVPSAEDSINKALSLYTNDLYARTYSQIYLVKLNSIINKGSALSDTDKTDLQTSLTQAVNGAQLAISYDSKNYLNFQLLGSVYQTAGALVGKDASSDAYTKSIDAYKGASNLNPNNPELKLDIASASFATGNTKDAEDYANNALSLKPDYIDALIFLSQLAKNKGDNAGALSYGERALAVTPDDKNLIQYVDSLKKGTSSGVVTTPTSLDKIKTPGTTGTKTP
jgi:tetratricopeptide (TPR) repeat protein